MTIFIHILLLSFCDWSSNCSILQVAFEWCWIWFPYSAVFWNDDIFGVLTGWVFASCSELQSICKSDQMTFMALCRLSRLDGFPKIKTCTILHQWFEARNLSAKESRLLGMPAFPSEILSRGIEQLGVSKNVGIPIATGWFTMDNPTKWMI